MIFYYLDASAWVKRDHQESGTVWVRHYNGSVSLTEVPDMDSVKESLHRTIESLSEEQARQVLELIKQFQQSNGDLLIRSSESNETAPIAPSHPAATWDEIFADKLPMGKQPFALDLSEVSGDDFLF